MLTEPTPSQPVEVFISYAHEDEELRARLAKYLIVLEREGLIKSWHGRQITPGKLWEREIDKHINSAQIILLLVSTDFIASEYCYGVEFKRAVERHDLGAAEVIPIILHACEWPETPIRRFHVLPYGGTPIDEWDHVDQAFLSVMKGIRKAVKELSSPESITYIKTDQRCDIPIAPRPGRSLIETLGDAMRGVPRFRYAMVIAVVAAVVLTSYFLSLRRPLDAYVNFPSPSPTVSPLPTSLPSPRTNPSPQSVRITISAVPRYDPVGGPNSRDRIAGKVSGVKPEEYSVVIYSFTKFWYVQPTTDHPNTQFNSDGNWNAEIQTGTRYAALVMPRYHKPPFTTTISPTQLDRVVASAEVEGKRIRRAVPQK